MNLPKFSAIDVEQFPKRLDALLNEQRESIKTLLKIPNKTWDNFMAPLEAMDDDLSKFWSPVSHMHSVVNSESLRKAYQESLPLLSDFSTELGQDPKLYEAIKSLQPRNATEAKIIADNCLSFELSGVALPKEKQSRFKAIQMKLSELSNTFENHLIDAINAWRLVIDDESCLKGIPEHALDTAKRISEAEGTWTLTLNLPCVQAVLSFCEDRTVREAVYHAYVTRASDVGPDAGRFNNMPVLEEILKLRSEKAELLGFESYTALSLAKKMADSCDAVIAFLWDLANKSKAQAQKEYQSLVAFSGLSELKPWDIAYYSEKQRQTLFGFSREDLRPYFPEHKVISGMFSLATRLFNIHFKSIDTFDAWHSDVQLYALQDASGQIFGHLYMDLYARADKRSGAWMDDCVGRCLKPDNSIQMPAAFLTCNFAPGNESSGAYLEHDEIVTLFHEFGHCLHHLLTKVDYLSVSGINGVEWDAVELPSQFFEHFAYSKTVLENLSEHKETHKSLPDDLYNKLMDAKNFQSAMMMARQLEFSLFDMSIHEKASVEGLNVLDILKEIRASVSVVPYMSYNRFPASFSHIFAGGYAAGYYSYKWAEVLSSDAFSRFEEEGLFDATCGQAFLDEILSVGGSRKAMASFQAFRGRAPKVDAMLRHNGIGATS